MNLLDWLLIGLVLTYALSGYWQGFITGACATAGLLLGGLTGVWLAPIALGDANPSVLVSLGALFIVILAATLGQAVFQYGGSRLRDQIQWQPFRAVDAVGGAALSAAAVLLVSWALGVAIAGSGISGITPLVRESAILEKVDQALPDSADGMLNAFNNVVGTTFFPRYLEPFAPERIVPVGPGPQRLLTDPDVLRAEGAVVKIQSVNSCGRGIEGSGFLYAPDRVMTNAHVVAGVDQPTVEIGGNAVSADRRLLRPRRRRGGPRGRRPARRPPSRSTSRSSPSRGWRSWASPRTGPSTCRPPGCGPSSGCGHPTSTATAPSSATCCRCAAPSVRATPVARCSPRPATWSGSSSRRR